MTKILLLLIALAMFNSCTDTIIQDSENENIELRASSITRDRGDWEDWSHVQILNLKNPVATPWNPNISTTAIPNYIRLDIKAEDGWDLIINTLDKSESKMNY